MLRERNMVVVLIILICMLTAVWTQVAFGFQNEPIGYMGTCPAVWGTPIEDLNCKLKKIKSFEDIKIDIYLPEQRSSYFKTLLIFIEGRLAATNTKIVDMRLLEVFLARFLKVYGDPTEVSEGLIAWRGQTAVIELDVFNGVITVGSPLGVASINELFEQHQRKKAKELFSS